LPDTDKAQEVKTSGTLAIEYVSARGTPTDTTDPSPQVENSRAGQTPPAIPSAPLLHLVHPPRGREQWGLAESAIVVRKRGRSVDSSMQQSFEKKRPRFLDDVKMEPRRPILSELSDQAMPMFPLALMTNTNSLITPTEAAVNGTQSDSDDESYQPDIHDDADLAHGSTTGSSPEVEDDDDDDEDDDEDADNDDNGRQSESGDSDSQPELNEDATGPTPANKRSRRKSGDGTTKPSRKSGRLALKSKKDLKDGGGGGARNTNNKLKSKRKGRADLKNVELEPFERGLGIEPDHGVPDALKELFLGWGNLHDEFWKARALVSISFNY